MPSRYLADNQLACLVMLLLDGGSQLLLCRNAPLTIAIGRGYVSFCIDHLVPAVLHYRSCCIHGRLLWSKSPQQYSSCAAGSVWSLKLSGRTWNGCNRCVTGRRCTSNSCSDGVKRTRPERWRCQAVQSLTQSLGTSIHRMYTSS